VPDPAVRDWYVTQDVQHGCSGAVLSHHITTGRQAADDELIRRGLTSDSDDVHQLR